MATAAAYRTTSSQLVIGGLRLGSDRKRPSTTHFDARIGEQQDLPLTTFSKVTSNDNSIGDLTSKLRTYGFCYIDECPVTPEATQQLVECIGPIRHTHYGGFWDFTSDLSSKDTAYTSLGLEAHTDTTYFSDPAGLQLFHLLSHTDGSGGESLLVDGFRAAEILKHEDPAAYRTLSEVGVWSHASGNEGVSIRPYKAFPVLQHEPWTGGLVQVRWNNADRAGLDVGFSRVQEWYDAAAKFDEILKRPESQYWEQLRPGRPLIFDNWRVLHGRSAFTGKRRMCGAYGKLATTTPPARTGYALMLIALVNRDDFVSRHNMATLDRAEVLRRTVIG
ncbi:hypothetical protein LTR66_008985 [Elasticomyces elasticus]|nr:hypothetical protein LTR66_008985 [Elasticomyces elasticus]KAK4993682.1 hypothetical protein LTR50_000293 [Elasticomyces elasticus]